MGTNLSLAPTTLKEANNFVEQFHRHNGRTARNGGKFAISVESDGADGVREMVGVAIVGNPLSATFMDGFTAEVLRVCVGPTAPKNACSILYAACWRAWRAMGGKKLITYTLTSESGASLRGAGWRTVGESKANSIRPGWNKKDHIVRDWQPIYGQAKFRWEMTADSSVLNHSEIRRENA